MRCLAAIRFDDGEDIDALLASFVRQLQARGRDVRGVLQSRSKTGGECDCADMDLHTIASDKIFRISQPLGKGSSGCRLDPGGLAECSAFLAREIGGGADLLVVNRFGKGESEGRGFRDLISTAVSQGIPVLTAVRPTYLPAWATFSQDYGVTLPFDLAALHKWIDALAEADAA